MNDPEIWEFHAELAGFEDDGIESVEDDEYRVLCGGPWSDDSDYCRSAARLGSLIDVNDYDVGFRVGEVR